MIEVSGLTKRFGDFTVLRDINCAFEPGVIYGVIGYNGAGKTSLLTLLAGIYRPDAGSVKYNGRDVFDDPKYKSRCFMMGEDQYFRPQSSIRRMCRFMRGYYPCWDEETAERLLDIFGLPDNTKLEEFSKGMRRQAEILLALSTSPNCLFLDESFDGLDWGKRELMAAVLKRYAEKRNACIVVTSHYLRELRDIADRFLLIKDRTSQELSITEAEKFFSDDDRRGREKIETLF